MKRPITTDLEDQRLAELQSFDLLDTPPEADFDFITKMASELCGVQMSLISLIDKGRQWFKSHHGTTIHEVPRDLLFSDNAIDHPQEVCQQNLSKREVLTLGQSIIRFYAGVPLVSGGHVMGILSVLDEEARSLSEAQLEGLRGLARQVMSLLELRRIKVQSMVGKKHGERFFDLNLDLSLIIEMDGTVVDINNQWPELIGYSKEEMIGTNILEYVYPGDLEGSKEVLRKLAEQEEVTRFGNRLLEKNGETRSIEWTGFPDGNLIYASGRDITELAQERQRFSYLAARNDAVMASLEQNTIVSIADLSGNITYANNTFCEISGYTREELLGKNHSIINSGHHPRSFWIDMWRTIAKGGFWRGEVCNISKQGEYYWVDTVVHPILNEDGKVREYIAIRYLITERKSIERRLLKSQSIMEQAGKMVKIGVWEIDLVKNTVYWSSVMWQIHEISEDYIPDMQSGINFFKEGESREKIVKLVSRAIEHGEAYDTELQFVTAKGNEIWVRAIGQAEFQNGKAERLYGTFQDITKTKETISRQGQFIDQVSSAMAMFDKNICYIAASQKWVSDYNLQDIDIIGKSHYEIFPGIRDDWKLVHQKCLQGETHKKDEDFFESVHGAIYWLKWEVKPWYDEHGQIGGILMFSEDITAKKVVEEKLMLSEKIFRDNFQYAGIGMAIVELTGEWKTVNPNLCQMLGYTEVELMNLTIQDLTHPDDLEDNLTLREELKEGKRHHYQVEKRYLHKSGKIVYTILSVSALRDVSGKLLHFITQIIDITEKKEAELTLSKVMSKNQAILDASTEVPIIETDSEGIIQTFNRGAEKMLGYRAAELINKYTLDFIHFAPLVKERAEELSKQFGETVDGVDTFTAVAKKEGSEVREWIYVHKSGQKIPVLLNITPIYSEGSISGFLGVAVDISAIKKAEEDLRSVLNLTQSQNQRLKNFAHIVSHNLRNHSGNLSALVSYLFKEQPELKEMKVMQHISTATENLTETIEHLSQVALLNIKNQGELERINLVLATRKAVENVAALSAENSVEVINEVKGDVEILGVPAYVDSIILNFLTNAIKYSSEERDSYVKLKYHSTKTDVMLSVEDNGLGIDLKRHRSKLFGMYKTFHQHEDSRGIGLFITKNQVEAMGGSIEVESQVNVGTKFKIRFKV